MKHLVALLLLAASSGAFAQAASVQSPDQVLLSTVIAQVNNAIKKYQAARGTGPDGLPPISSAEFDFKTTTAITVGGTISIFIFKFGTSHEKDTTNDVTYTYALPTPPHTLSKQAAAAPPALDDQLAQTIQGAAKAVLASSTAAGLPFSKLTVNLQYGVTWDGNGAAAVPISIVTVGVSGEAKQNTVQSIKLVFGK